MNQTKLHGIIWRLRHRLRRWRDKGNSEKDIHEALTRDQCRHGFDHTVEEIMRWLYRCTFTGTMKLQKKIQEHINEVNEMRAKGNIWHGDDRP